MNLDHHLSTFYGPQGGFFQTFTGDFSVNDTWVYRHLTAAESPEDRRWHFTGTATLFQRLAAGARPFTSRRTATIHRCTPTTTSSRVVGSRHHIHAHSSAQPLYSQHGFTSSLFSTPQFAQALGSILYISGRDENFYEWASADIAIPRSRSTGARRIGCGVWLYLLRATSTTPASDQSLVESSDSHPETGSRVPTLASLLLRLIGQYNAASTRTACETTREPTCRFITADGSDRLVRPRVSLHDLSVPAPGALRVSARPRHRRVHWIWKATSPSPRPFNSSRSGAPRTASS